jgi:RNA polymerase sigma-70 factor (ECF subfamily)
MWQVREGAIASVLQVRPVPDAAPSIDEQLSRLIDDHERSLYNFLLALVRDPDVALDCAQDTFLRAYENLRKGKPVNAPWLFKVARNRAMDEFRRSSKFRPEADPSDAGTVHEPTDRNLAVRQAFAQLSPPDREVLYLFDVAGFKTDEIGKMLGVRGSAIRQRLSRARVRLRAAYGADV